MIGTGYSPPARDRAGRGRGPPRGRDERVDAERVREACVNADHGLRARITCRRPGRKIEATGPGPVWHMIGHVQANKAKYIPRLFDYVHSVDRWELLEELDRHEKPLHVLFEVNLSGEPQKHGTDEGWP